MSVQPSPSRTVGGYTLLAKLGEGGMGVVHLASKGDGPRVAMKVLRPHIIGDDEARARLAREVSSLERIRSRWIAEIVDADPWADTPYVATRYVPGLSLHDHVPEEGPILGDDLRWFARCLAEGVASVHAVGVLHRDVKPSNVLLEGRTPILIDFGLARVADDPKLTHTGWLLGTPGYLAPEILFGDDATTASDVHSWAATVAFAGTGHPPFGRGPSMAVMDRVRRGEHDLGGLPDDLRAIVSAALAPDPTRRPSLGDLRGWLAEHPRSPTVTLRRPADDDPFTIPLALAAHEGTAAPTRLDPVPTTSPPGPRVDPPTRPLTAPVL
ncbi:MAG: serine/threonine-protein kinase, partial [Nocardioides sp.]